MNELDKLQKYLDEHNIPYERIDDDSHVVNRHQICVPTADLKKKEWDAICHYGSYGYGQGLLEIYGSIANEEIDSDSVVGWLTAEDVIERIKNENREN